MSMSYCDPKTVHGPKNRVSNVKVIYNGRADGSSVAELDWDGEPGIGIRWNGNNDKPLGTPQSHGNPVWFLVPGEFEDVVRERARELAQSSLEADYREMAADAEREGEATEWANALISDVSHEAR